MFMRPESLDLEKLSMSQRKLLCDEGAVFRVKVEGYERHQTRRGNRQGLEEARKQRLKNDLQRHYRGFDRCRSKASI